MSCYCSKLVCYDVDSGKRFPLSCRSYTCSEHGRNNQGRLRAALQKYLESWDQIRFWTFTLSSKAEISPEKHIVMLNKVWRYFITELRRNKVCTVGEKNTQFIRFVEPHKSGYFHFHAVFDRYIQWSKINTLWCHAVAVVTGSAAHLGGCFVKGINNAKNTAFYIVKYVTKSSGRLPRGFRIWSRSARVALFPKKPSGRTYVIYNPMSDTWIGVLPEVPLLEVFITQLREEEPIWSLFDTPF